MSTRLCPALFIAAPASGQGKTTITAALARHHRRQGLSVRVFKTGPDFLDPMILEQASGAPVYQLDLWMGGEQHCRDLLFSAALEADLILVEGVMGLFDGEPSSADLATLFNIPILAVINGSAMAQTFGALAYGLANYREGLPFAGVLANKVSSDTHYQMLLESLPEGMRCYGRLPKDDGLSLPSRHLGLLQANEIQDLQARIEHAADSLQGSGTELPPAIEFSQDHPPLNSSRQALAGRRIAVARDAAFAFLYRANLELLEEMGAELAFFSPLVDESLPQADALYLPGGYPELHLEQLSANQALHAEILAHHQSGKPIVAECGGMLYLSQALTDKQGKHATMVGLLPGEAKMQQRLANLGMHRIELPEGQLRGHTFHHSLYHPTLTPIATSEPSRKGRPGEAAYRVGSLHASYMHFYFPSNPGAVAKLFTPTARPALT